MIRIELGFVVGTRLAQNPEQYRSMNEKSNQEKRQQFGELSDIVARFSESNAKKYSAILTPRIFKTASGFGFTFEFRKLDSLAYFLGKTSVYSKKASQELRLNRCYS